MVKGFSHLSHLTTPDWIWRPYVFANVTASIFTKQGKTLTKIKTVTIPGRYYSEYASGPNLSHLADAVAEMEGLFNGEYVGLESCEYKGFQDGIYR